MGECIERGVGGGGGALGVVAREQRWIVVAHACVVIIISNITLASNLKIILPAPPS